MIIDCNVHEMKRDIIRTLSIYIGLLRSPRINFHALKYYNTDLCLHVLMTLAPNVREGLGTFLFPHTSSESRYAYELSYVINKRERKNSCVRVWICHVKQHEVG